MDDRPEEPESRQYSEQMKGKTGHKHHHGTWNDIYEGAKPEDLPWFSPEPDTDIMQLIDKLVPGMALDIGCGPGVHAIELAKRGWDVTALDISPGAIKMAEECALKAGVEVEFRIINVLAFEPDGSFDLVLDRGFLHSLEPTEYPRWTDMVAAALKPGGIVVAKEFTIDPVNRFGPTGLSESEMRDVLDRRFTIERLEQTEFSVRGQVHDGLILLGIRV
ncbi:MAG: class I SAM-dependent methyltransferase [ANME-2 cluster archaeon]|nr:class I SAM-dependent methyltransferase [ANME-2 cluster archaeon]